MELQATTYKFAQFQSQPKCPLMTKWFYSSLYNHCLVRLDGVQHHFWIDISHEVGAEELEKRGHVWDQGTLAKTGRWIRNSLIFNYFSNKLMN